MKPQRIGLFGLLGTGNLGNDGSLAAVLGHLRAEHPDALLDAFCGGPDEVTERFGIPATRLNWYRGEYRTASGLRSMVLKGLGKIVDVFRTAAWVSRHDVVIVPGMGVLESTLPVRPWGFPYSLLLMCLSGRLFGTEVALLSVGASVVENRGTRAVVVRAAKAAGYRSYRDRLSHDAMRTMGVDTEGDRIFPDLVFGVPGPVPATGSGIVGVGVMDYRGGNEDRRRAEQVRARYVAGMTAFVRWLVEGGRRVRLFTGDHGDMVVAEAIVEEVRSPFLEVAQATSLDELTGAMAEVDTVVATRYHNVVSALRLGKPTVSVGYAAKNDALMASMGLGVFCQAARTLDVHLLIQQFIELERRHDELRAIVVAHSSHAAALVEGQFKELSEVIDQVAPRENRVRREVG